MGSDLGMKVSQLGKDVNTAGDSELLLSSSWPLLKIVHEGKFDVSLAAGASPTIIQEHSLNYYPMFLVFYTSTESLNDGFSRLHFSTNTTLSVEVDTKSLGVYADDSFSGSLKGYYYIFDLNLEEEFKAPIISSGESSTGSSGDFGIKVVKQNQDINSSDPLDYSIFSSTRSPLIHQVSPANLEPISATRSGATIVHSLPYKPMFVTYAKGDVRYSMLGTGDPIDLQFVVNQQTIEVTSASDKTISAIIFKDPFEVSTAEKVAM